MHQIRLAARLFAVCTAVFAYVLANAVHAAPSKGWTIVSLGALGSRGSIPLAINNRGDIVGYSAGKVPGSPWGEEAYHPFLWQNGTMTDLGLDMGNPPGSAYTHASAVNDQGTILGNGPDGIQVWRDGVRTPVGFTGAPEDINKSGTIVGGYHPHFGMHPFVYQDGVFLDLGTLGGTHASAVAINDKGVVVGTSQLQTDRETRAFVFENGVLKDLGTLGGSSESADINNKGVIVGRYLVGGTNKAFIHDRGGMRPLFDANVAVPTGNQYAQAINDHGTVTGNFENTAFVYEDGQLTFLDTLPVVQAAGWATLFVMDINDRGWITGWGWRRDDPSGNGHGFVLIPK